MTARLRVTSGDVPLKSFASNAGDDAIARTRPFRGSSTMPVTLRALPPRLGRGEHLLQVLLDEPVEREVDVAAFARRDVA